MIAVNRVEQHQINKNHELFKMIDDYSFKSKSLYNYANYLLRQTFIITSKIKNESHINQEQQEFINWINVKVDEFNNKKQIIFNKKLENGIQTKMELKMLSYFDATHKYLGYDFLEFVVSDTNDYKVLMAQVAQQTLRLLDKNWISFFESIKDWNKHPDKYKGMPKLPNYKHKTNGRFNVVFTNQNCSIKNNIVKFPTCFNGYKLNTKITGKLQQVRINPMNNQYVIEIVCQKEISTVNKERNNIVGIDLGLNNFVTMTNNVGLTPVVINGRVIKSINQFYNK
jgi:putative transposase